jgi:hypothetical protein
MSTKTTTDTTNQYNRSAMGNYNMFQGLLGANVAQMVNNPLGSTFFKNQLSQQLAQSRQIATRSNSNVLQNLRAGGGVLSNSGGLTAAMLGRNQIGNNVMSSNAFNSALNTALNNRNVGMMSMQSYQPLQTGQNSTQTTGGLGTWLPQLAGAALGMVAPGLGSMMGGGSFSSGYKQPAAPSYTPAPSSGSMPNPWASVPNFQQPTGIGYA